MRRGEHYPLIPLTKHVTEKVNEESSSIINERCFEFVQKLIMKTSQVVDMMSGAAFSGIYARERNQCMQCCILPMMTNETSFIKTMQCQLLWSSLMKAINSIVRDNRRKKIKKWSCKCTTSTAQINDFVLLCQPLAYNLTSLTLHTSMTWYLYSTSDSFKHPNEADEAERDEWG